MPANIEIKARARDFAALERRAAALSDAPCQTIAQEDVFFHVRRGRLKLRIPSAGRAQLVYYERPDQAAPKRSDYFIFETEEAATLQTVLAAALGVRGIVRKTRRLYLVGQTRIHLDRVEGLGEFVELEVVLRPGQTDADGRAIADDLMARLEIRQTDLVHEAYIDLLENAEK
ncbi:MAG: class IV adenylate cyclase [Anaerolineales bacterium]